MKNLLNLFISLTMLLSLQSTFASDEVTLTPQWDAADAANEYKHILTSEWNDQPVVEFFILASDSKTAQIFSDQDVSWEVNSMSPSYMGIIFKQLDEPSRVQLAEIFSRYNMESIQKARNVSEVRSKVQEDDGFEELLQRAIVYPDRIEIVPTIDLNDFGIRFRLNSLDKEMISQFYNEFMELFASEDLQHVGKQVLAGLELLQNRWTTKNNSK